MILYQGLRIICHNLSILANIVNDKVYVILDKLLNISLNNTEYLLTNISVILACCNCIYLYDYTIRIEGS